MLITTNYVLVDGLEFDGTRIGFTMESGAQISSADAFEAFARARNTEQIGSLNGDGIFPDGRTPNGIHHICIYDCVTRGFPGSGIQTAFCDYLVVQSNLTFGNGRWSRYGKSGISIFEGKNYTSGSSGDTTRTYCMWNVSYANEQIVTSTFINQNSITDGNAYIIDLHQVNGYSYRTLFGGNLGFDCGGAGVVITGSNNVDIFNNTLYGNNRVRGGGGEVLRIDSPAVTVYGTTTEIALRKMLASDAAEDGLIGRTIAVRGIHKNNPEADGDFEAVLTPTVKVLRRRASDAHSVWQSGIGPGRLIPEPMPCGYTDGAKADLKALRVEFGWRRNEESDSSMQTVFARAVEKIERIAMCLAVVDSPLEPRICEQAVKAAAMLVEASNACLAESLGAAKLVADIDRGTPYAKCLAALEDVLRRAAGGWVSRHELNTKTRTHGKPLRDMALEELLDAELVEESTHTGGGRRSVVYRWAGESK